MIANYNFTEKDITLDTEAGPKTIPANSFSILLENVDDPKKYENKYRELVEKKCLEPVGLAQDLQDQRYAQEIDGIITKVISSDTAPEGDQNYVLFLEDQIYKEVAEKIALPDDLNLGSIGYGKQGISGFAEGVVEPMGYVAYSDLQSIAEINDELHEIAVSNGFNQFKDLASFDIGDNYSRLVSKEGQLKEGSLFEEEAPSTLIVDEAQVFVNRGNTLYNDVSDLLESDEFRKEAQDHFKNAEYDSESEKQEGFRNLLSSNIEGNFGISEYEGEDYTKHIAEETLSKLASGEQDQMSHKDVLKIKGAEAMIGKEKVHEIFSEQEALIEENKEDMDFVLSENCPEEVIVQHREDGSSEDLTHDLDYSPEMKDHMVGEVETYNQEQIVEAHQNGEDWPEELGFGASVATIRDETQKRVNLQALELVKEDTFTAEDVDNAMFGDEDKLEEVLNELDISSENVPLEELREIQHDAASQVKEFYQERDERKEEEQRESSSMSQSMM